MAQNKCPYCGKLNCIHSVVFTNADMYGSKLFNISCKYCHGAITVYIIRRVVLDFIEKGNHDSDVFGYEVKKPVKIIKKIIPKSGKATIVHSHI